MPSSACSARRPRRRRRGRPRQRAHADAELARMLTDFAAERTAADRPVPSGLYRVLALAGPETRKES
ncbi:hypothetical protein GCM10017687_87940 [Streptomyces echinatus]